MIGVGDNIHCLRETVLLYDFSREADIFLRAFGTVLHKDSFFRNPAADKVFFHDICLRDGLVFPLSACDDRFAAFMGGKIFICRIQSSAQRYRRSFPVNLAAKYNGGSAAAIRVRGRRLVKKSIFYHKAGNDCAHQEAHRQERRKNEADPENQLRQQRFASAVPSDKKNRAQKKSIT